MLKYTIFRQIILSVQVSYKKQFLIFLLLGCIFLIVLETGVRTINHVAPYCMFMPSEVFDDVDIETQRDICRSNDNIKWTNFPIAHVPNQKLDVININSDGFRGPELKQYVQNESIRIFLVGGSTVLSSSSTSDSTTITGFLQKTFNDHGYDNVEIINAGHGGAISYSELNLIKNRIKNLNPDIVIVYNGWNDINRPLHAYESDSTSSDLSTKSIRDIIKNDFSKTPQLLYKYYNLWKYDQDNFVREFDDSDINEKATLFKSHISEMCNVAKNSDFKLIHILQPIVGSGSKILTEEELRHVETYDTKNVLLNYELYAMKQKELQSQCDQIFDFRNIFDSTSQTLYTDACHVGDLGAKIISDEMFEILLPLVNTQK
tara:strand:+ start:17712 stop:18836 length:1125 start_codon:yes stop_codon:yes gene_type:complete